MRSAARLRRLATDDRPRERALALGVSALTADELVALLLGQGARGRDVLELAGDLVAEAGGLRRLSTAGVDALATRGVGPAKALRLAAAFELGRRTRAPRAERRPVARTSGDLVRALAPRLRPERREVLLVVPLSARLHVLGAQVVARGTACSAVVPVSEVFAHVLAQRAPRFALAHNHPSGDPRPSRADEVATARVAAAAALLGVELVDHVIVGAPRRWYSFADAGRLARPGGGPGRRRRRRAS